MHYFLKQLVGPHTSNRIEINIIRNVVIFGRKHSPGLCRFSKLCKHHAAFYRTVDNRLYIRDLKSVNGVFVNGMRIGRALHILHLGDIIGFGTKKANDGFVCVLCQADVRVSDDDDDDESSDKNESASLNQSNEDDVLIELSDNDSDSNRRNECAESIQSNEDDVLIELSDNDGDSSRRNECAASIQSNDEDVQYLPNEDHSSTESFVANHPTSESANVEHPESNEHDEQPGTSIQKYR